VNSSPFWIGWKMPGSRFSVTTPGLRTIENLKGYLYLVAVRYYIPSYYCPYHVDRFHVISHAARAMIEWPSHRS
jgi:hypothetical protein